MLSTSRSQPSSTLAVVAVIRSAVLASPVDTHVGVTSTKVMRIQQETYANILSHAGVPKPWQQPRKPKTWEKREGQ
jgi:hypothetical protein